MARGQVVKRIVNALSTQDRIMYHAACGHVVSVTRREIEAAGRSPESYVSPEIAMIECPFCPDPPPATEEDVRRAKTANQLWKEAGQP